MGRLTCLALLAAALLLTSCSGSSGAGSTMGTVPASSAPDTSPLVTSSGDQFVGRDGQPVQLRGFNIHNLDPAVYQEAVTLGANFVRVTTPWSDYETVPPSGDVHHWDTARLAELDQLVSFCNEHHINVLLDLHQYGWSPYFAAVQRGGRANGIPAWFYQDGRYTGTPPGRNQAKEQFFNAREGAALYGDFGAMMAERYRHSPSVMGYEIMNEPDTGTLPRNHATTQLLVRWEAQVLGRLRAVDDTRTTVFMLRGGPSMGACTSTWPTSASSATSRSMSTTTSRAPAAAATSRTVRTSAPSTPPPCRERRTLAPSPARPRTWMWACGRPTASGCR